MRQKGVVVWFNNGYGFISRENAGDIFVHYTGINGSGFKKLEAEQVVEFDIGKNRTGEMAVSVDVIDG